MCEGCVQRELKINALERQLGQIQKRIDQETAPLMPAIREAFDYWRLVCNHPTAKLTRDRQQKIQARLREGYKTDFILRAIDGAGREAYVSPTGRRFDDIELICRTGSKLEAFEARARRTLDLTRLYEAA